ncbi:Gfo/Idh/MocA family protein [Planctomicrobium sp. SH661]|uniref:Gfo/Idh/MocA family protein n=1 Tax=Planctomicrobium sp. SH661 TaxID=3448124 RepID=UPI003F5B5507
MSRLLHHVLVIGTGSIGERHLRCFLSTERANVGFVELREDQRNVIAERYPAARPYASLESAFADRFGAAVIATPAPLHIPQAIQCLTQGLHVLIEKPLSVQLTGIDELKAAVEQSGKVAAVAYVYRANPVLAEFREVLRSGKYGPPRELVAVAGQNFPTYRPAYAQTYYASHAQGGGAVQDALTHVINAGQWLIGDIDRLVADFSHQQLPHVTVEDTVHVLARQAGVLSSYSLNQHQFANEIVITVACAGGTLRYENHLNRWRVMEKPDGPWIDSVQRTLQRDDLFIRQAAAFLDALEGKQEPLCTLAEGLATLQVNRAIIRSVETGSWRVPSQEPAE